MPAPRLYHGVRRGFNEFFSGIALAIAFKVMSSIIPDPLISFYLNIGFWLLVIGSVILLVLKMEYWNIGYTFGVVLSGVLIVYAFRELISPFDIIVYIAAAFYLYRKISNKIYRRSYYRRWDRW